MIGVVLAGGSGTRLYPLTKALSKQLLPVYDKPMIYYPISTLMLAGIREIILITTPSEQVYFKRLLGDGEELGIELHYVLQPLPEGIAQAFTLCEEFIEGRKVALILGDNIFHGASLGTQLRSFQNVQGANIFGYRVSNPSEYGVAELGHDGKILSIEEKPRNPKSNLAIPGLYFYDESALAKSKEIKKSERGEFEITSLNRIFLEEESLNLQILKRGTTWLDTGTFNALYEASSYVQVLQERQGYKIACLEEISFRNGWITKENMESMVKRNPKNAYFIYLNNILSEGE